jgi:O-antigen ligase
MVEWLSYSILILLLLIGIFSIVLFWKKSKNFGKIETDYQVFFILGICFLPLGIIFSTTISIGFLGITAFGLIYMIIGLANLDKWNEN